MIELMRPHAKAPLGFKVAGGIDKPYSGATFDADGIYVLALEKSPALESGLKVGDQIVSVDGHSVRSVTHSEALAVLRKSGLLVQLEVSQDDEDDDRIDEHIVNSELDQEDVKVVVILPAALTQRPLKSDVPHSPQSEMVDSGYDEMSTLESLREELEYEPENKKKNNEIENSHYYYPYWLVGLACVGALVYYRAR